jgi:hypothetical protein
MDMNNQEGVNNQEKKKKKDDDEPMSADDLSKRFSKGKTNVPKRRKKRK